MKLLNYTYRNLSLFLIIVFSIWGALFYFTILDVIIDETDDALENYHHILVKTALHDPAILETEGRIMTYYKFRPISAEEASKYKKRFFNSTIYIEIEDEWEPVRVMQSCFRMSDERYYELEVMISTVEQDDMIGTILIYLILLFVMMLLCFALIIRIVLERSFRPLDRLVGWLENIRPGKEPEPLENPTEIVEFRKLTDAALDMSYRSYKAYQDQKQFIENASHELQTPLAIIQAKIELLADTEGLTERQMEELDNMYHTLGRAVKLNKSLLLISKIENEQFLEEEQVSFNDITKNTFQELQDIFEWKKIHFIQKDTGEFIFKCNILLAKILINNLLKNALTHIPENGVVEVFIHDASITIINDGNKPLDKEKIFERFYHNTDKKESTGLGLAISKSIAKSYNLNLEYSWREDGKHIFTILK